MTDDVDLTPDQLAAAIERLEAEKARRAAGKPSAPAVPTRVERHVRGPETNPIISNPAPRRAKPKPRKAKPRAARPAPVPFFIYVTAKAIGADPGTIEEGHYVVQDGKVFLSDASGIPSGEGHTILRDALWTAKTALRQRLAAQRGDRPNHRPIQYRDTGWR